MFNWLAVIHSGKLHDRCEQGQSMALKDARDNVDDVDALYRRHRIRVMLAITLGYGFIYTCRLGLSIVKKPLIDGNIFTVEELGLIGSALFYAYACGKFFNGFLSDHFRPRLFFSFSIFASALINLFMGWSTLLWLSVLLWALNGWFQGMAAPSAVISITNWFGLKERGRRYGVWNASHSIGEGLTFYVIAVVVSIAGWRYGFILPGIICIAVSAWVYTFLQNAPATIGLPDIHDWVGEPSHDTKAENTWRTQKIVFGIRAMWIVAISSGLMYVTRYAINSWGVLYLQEAYGYSLVEAGTFIAFNTVAGIFGSILYGYVSDKIFDARRPPANLLFAIVEVIALFIIFYGPQNTVVLAFAFRPVWRRAKWTCCVDRRPVRRGHSAQRRRRGGYGFCWCVQLSCGRNSGVRDFDTDQSGHQNNRRCSRIRLRRRHHVLDQDHPFCQCYWQQLCGTRRFVTDG